MLGNTVGSRQVKSATGGKEGPESEADHSKLGDGSFNEQQSSHTGFVLVVLCQSPDQPSRVLRVYIKVLISFNHIFSPGGLSNSLFFQGYVLETESHCGQNIHSHTAEGGVGPPIAGVQFTRSPPTVVSYILIRIMAKIKWINYSNIFKKPKLLQKI